MSIIKNYTGLLIVIVLWIAIWSISDTLGKKYLKTHEQKMFTFVCVAIIASAILIIYFPNQMNL